MDSALSKKYESFLHEQLGPALSELPLDMLIPLNYESDAGKEEIVFIAKCSADQYTPVTQRESDDIVPISVHMEMVPSRFSFAITLDDLALQIGLQLTRAEEILRCLYDQEKITVILLDHQTLHVVWLTTEVHFEALRHNYDAIFQFFAIPDQAYEGKRRIVVIPPNQQNQVSYISADPSEQGRQLRDILEGEPHTYSSGSFLVITNHQDLPPTSDSGRPDHNFPIIIAKQQDSELGSLSIDETWAALSAFSDDE